MNSNQARTDASEKNLVFLSKEWWKQGKFNGKSTLFFVQNVVSKEIYDSQCVKCNTKGKQSFMDKSNHLEINISDFEKFMFLMK